MSIHSTWPAHWSLAMLVWMAASGSSFFVTLAWIHGTAQRTMTWLFKHLNFTDDIGLLSHSLNGRKLGPLKKGISNCIQSVWFLFESWKICRANYSHGMHFKCVLTSTRISGQLKTMKIGDWNFETGEHFGVESHNWNDEICAQLLASNNVSFTLRSLLH